MGRGEWGGGEMVGEKEKYLWKHEYKFIDYICMRHKTYKKLRKAQKRSSNNNNKSSSSNNHSKKLYKYIKIYRSFCRVHNRSQYTHCVRVHVCAMAYYMHTIKRERSIKKAAATAVCLHFISVFIELDSVDRENSQLFISNNLFCFFPFCCFIFFVSCRVPCIALAYVYICVLRAE